MGCEMLIKRQPLMDYKRKKKKLIQSLPSFLPCFFFFACGNEPRYCRCSPASQSLRGKCWSFRMGNPICLATWYLSLLPSSQSCAVILWERRDWKEQFQEGQHKWAMAEACSGLWRGGGGVWFCPFPVQRMWSRVFSLTVWNRDWLNCQELFVWTVMGIFWSDLIFTAPWNPPA